MLTGAASGIGLGYADAIATNGAHVTLVDVDGDALRESGVSNLRAVTPKPGEEQAVIDELHCPADDEW